MDPRHPAKDNGIHKSEGQVAPPSSTSTTRWWWWDGLVGRGVRPPSLWSASVLVPVALVLALSSAGEDHDHPALVALCVFVAAWTVPFDWLGAVLTDVGKFRECLADCAPLMPGLLPYLPQLLPPLVMNLHRVAPHAGTLAPYLKDLLAHPAFISKALPILMRKIEVMAPMIDMIGPHFKEMDERHFAKLELVIEDLVDQIEELAPYFHIIAPHIVEISLRADKLFPIIHYIIPHAEACQDHIKWLIPFADIDGFDDLLPYMDKLVPHLEVFAPYGPMLLPYMGKMRKHIPILLENAETLLPQLGGVVDHMDPLVYWLSDLLPLANSVGILKSKFLLSAGMPLIKFLPAVPESAQTRTAPPQHQPPATTTTTTTTAPPPPRHASSSASDVDDADVDEFRRTIAKRHVKLSKVKHVGDTVYFAINVDGRYAGEFRYSALRALDRLIKTLPNFRKPLPPFPGKSVFGLSATQLEERREALEEYLRFVLSEPDICATREFIDFVKKNRRWDAELPMLASPLMATTT